MNNVNLLFTSQLCVNLHCVLAFFIDHLYNNRLLVFNYKKRSNTLLVISAYISVFFSSY